MKEKTMYCSPQTLVLELKSEGVICASRDSFDVTNPFEDFSEFLL